VERSAVHGRSLRSLHANAPHRQGDVTEHSALADPASNGCLPELALGHECEAAEAREDDDRRSWTSVMNGVP